MTNIYNHKGNIMALPVNYEVYEDNEKKSHNIKKNESDELDKLFEALAKAQMEMEVAATASINPFFKSRYADLASIVKASRPFLAKNGLCVIQRTITEEKDQIFLYTRLCHASGQWIESNMQVKPLKNDIQGLGSYITYLRRYMYASLTGVVTGDEDDDGETAMQETRKEKKEEEDNGKISKAQLQVLSNELNNCPEIVEGILKGFNITKLSDLPSKKYSGCVERIREIKRAKES